MPLSLSQVLLFNQGCLNCMCKRAVLLAKKLSVEGESFHFGAPVILLELLRENKK